MLPARRKRVRSGIERVPERRYPAHLKWVRGFECSVHNCAAISNSETAVVAAHVRGETDGGSSLKPSDWWVLSLCNSHHEFQHQFGEATFEKYYVIDMKAKAIEFAKASPVEMVRKMAGVRITEEARQP